jgi:hypothetical protein
MDYLGGIGNPKYWKKERKAYQRRMVNYEAEQKRRDEERANQQRQSAMCIGNRDNRFTGAYQDPPRPEWLPDLRQLERRIETQEQRIVEQKREIEEWKRFCECLKQVIEKDELLQWKAAIRPPIADSGGRRYVSVNLKLG